MLHLLASFLALVPLAASLPSPDTAGPEFNWTSISPSLSLAWTPCYDGIFRCARLLVPLDYASEFDSSSSRTAALAIMKLPAAVPASSPLHGGPVFINPGGPSGSGIDLVRRAGSRLQSVLDTAGVRHHDMIGWDPRGVGLTTPSASCFDDALDRDVQKLQLVGLGTITEVGGSYLVKRLWGMKKVLGAACAGRAAADDLRYVGTASTARDIVEMADRIGEEQRRTTEAARFAAGSGGGQKPLARGRPVERVDDGPARIQYLGFSYGTVLGNTLVSMFPGRAGRIILDGVCDVDDYFSLDGWLHNLQDSDKVIGYFCETCFAAQSGCPLYRESDSSPDDIWSRVSSLIGDLDESPKAVAAPLPNGSSHLITGESVRFSIFRSVYSPIGKFPSLARALADALEGNYTLIAEAEDQNGPPDLRRDACGVGPGGSGASSGPTAAAAEFGDREAGTAILCGDSGSRDGVGWEYWVNYTQTLRSQSETLSGQWAQIRLSCSGWTDALLPRYHFTGPFTSPPASANPEPGRPLAPVLFLSSEYDPVTPARNAFAMARRHPGAGVVVQTGAGHCAIGSGRSECTNHILREYMRTGAVPEPGTVCEVECKPFEEGCRPGMGPSGAETRAGAGAGMGLRPGQPLALAY